MISARLDNTDIIIVEGVRLHSMSLSCPMSYICVIYAEYVLFKFSIISTLFIIYIQKPFLTEVKSLPVPLFFSYKFLAALEVSGYKVAFLKDH